MPINKTINVGKKRITAVAMKLGSKKLIILKGRKGYIACGYIDLKAAEKFNDAAAKITGVSTVNQALKTKIFDCTLAARDRGIYKGQSVEEAASILA